MKKKILTYLLATISLVVLGLGMVQLSTRVVKADGCPSEPFAGCFCDLSDAQGVQSGDQIHWYCTYNCSCGGGGGAEPFFIIREADYWQ